MKFAKIILAVSMFAGSSAFAATGGQSTNSTCQHQDKTRLTEVPNNYIKTVFSQPAPAKKEYQQVTPTAVREGSNAG